jgi:hypothetical protein
MRKVSITLLLLIFCLNALSQDIITMRDGAKIEARVSEVGSKNILYKRFSNLNGPVYTLDKEDVALINYESGAIDKFNMMYDEKPSYANVKSRMDPSELKSNIIYMNAGDLLFQNVTLAYERLIGNSRKLGIRFPFSLNLNGTSKISDGNNNRIRNIFYSGFDLLFYPTGQGQLSLVLGPSIRTGMVQYRPNNNVYIDPFYPTVQYIENTTFFSFLIQGGFVWNPSKELAISTTFGIGTRKVFTSIPGATSSGANANLNFSLGYRF